MLKLMSWNINSVRLRLPLIESILSQEQPDLVCLQEIKCETELFPKEAFVQMGYPYSAVYGQKSYNGVAIVAKHPFLSVDQRAFMERDEARHICVTLDPCCGFSAPLTIHNLYIPAGGDLPDPALNPKYADKLAFLDALVTWSEAFMPCTSTILVGDFNVAPYPDDVWSHNQLRNVVSHTEPEIKRLLAFLKAGPWCDVVRMLSPEPQKVYTWWSYRARDWERSNRGRRLDHCWVSQDLKSAVRGYTIMKAVRGMERPSDHVPVVVELASLL